MDNSNINKYDYIIIGAGFFGLYSALLLSHKPETKIAVLDCDTSACTRASFINQARVHNGYHYPRSIETAARVSQHYKRFLSDFDFSINNSFKQIYAISEDSSKVSAAEYIGFCQKVGIPLKVIDEKKYFRKGSVEAAFETDEASFDFKKIRQYLLKELSSRKNVKIHLGANIDYVFVEKKNYIIHLKDDRRFMAPFVINATYASTNQIINKFGFESFKIKYELCEVILCDGWSFLFDYAFWKKQCSHLNRRISYPSRGLL